MLDDYIKKIYCINLDHRPDRWEECLSEFQKYKISNVERIPGIVITSEPDSISKEQEGCYLSHFKIYKLIAENDMENAMIFEDDIKFCKNFNEEIESCLQNLPDDFDVMYIGGSFVLVQPCNQYVYQVKNCGCCSSYIISNKFANWLIKNIGKAEKPIDCVLIDLQHRGDFKFYISYKPLVWQKQGYSDIVKNNVDYYDLMKKWYNFDIDLGYEYWKYVKRDKGKIFKYKNETTRNH